MNSQSFDVEDFDPDDKVHWSSEHTGQLFYLCFSDSEQKFHSLAETANHTGNIVACVQYEQSSDSTTIGASRTDFSSLLQRWRMPAKAVNHVFLPYSFNSEGSYTVITDEVECFWYSIPVILRKEHDYIYVKQVWDFKDHCLRILVLYPPVMQDDWMVLLNTLQLHEQESPWVKFHLYFIEIALSAWLDDHPRFSRFIAGLTHTLRYSGVVDADFFKNTIRAVRGLQFRMDDLSRFRVLVKEIGETILAEQVLLTTEARAVTLSIQNFKNDIDSMSDACSDLKWELERVQEEATISLELLSMSYMRANMVCLHNITQQSQPGLLGIRKRVETVPINNRRMETAINVTKFLLPSVITAALFGMHFYSHNIAQKFGNIQKSRVYMVIGIAPMVLMYALPEAWTWFRRSIDCLSTSQNEDKPVPYQPTTQLEFFDEVDELMGWNIQPESKESDASSVTNSDLDQNGMTNGNEQDQESSKDEKSHEDAQVHE